jgi:hypothetical protein
MSNLDFTHHNAVGPKRDLYRHLHDIAGWDTYGSAQMAGTTVRIASMTDGEAFDELVSLRAPKPVYVGLTQNDAREGERGDFLRDPVAYLVANPHLYAVIQARVANADGPVDYGQFKAHFSAKPEFSMVAFANDVLASQRLVGVV